MIGVSTTVVADRSTDIFRDRVQVRDQFFDAFAFLVGAFNGCIDFSEIGVMMFAVVDFHRASINVGFESIV